VFFCVDKECDKREAEYVKARGVVRGEFQTLCKQLGIQGQKIKRELISLIAELPDIYSKLADGLKTLAQAVEFYAEFVKYIFGKEHPGGCVPLLKYVISKFILFTVNVLQHYLFPSFSNPAANVSVEVDV
jgi:hypothetical protein